MKKSAGVTLGFGVTIICAQVTLLFANAYGRLVPDNPVPYGIAMVAALIAAGVLIENGSEKDR
jgi:hypothetical protein